MEKPGNTLLRVFYCHWKRLKLNGCVIGTFNSEMKIKMGLMPTYTTFVVLKREVYRPKNLFTASTRLVTWSFS